MIVMKFGGTSVQDAAAINRAADIVSGKVGQKPVVVASAMARVTDTLLKIGQVATERQFQEAKRLVEELRARHLAGARNLLAEVGATGDYGLEKVENALSGLFKELDRL